MRARRLTSLVAAGAVLLAACGATGEPAAQQADDTAPTAPGATVAPSVASATAPSTAAPVTTAAPSEQAPATEQAPTTGQAPDSAPAPTAPPTSPPVPARDDGCSADNASTPTDVADGPSPSLEVNALSASNPLPDLAVRRINCSGGWVNFKNELPSDRPLLVWFWAPH